VLHRHVEAVPDSDRDDRGSDDLRVRMGARRARARTVIAEEHDHRRPVRPQHAIPGPVRLKDVADRRDLRAGEIAGMVGRFDHHLVVAEARHGDEALGTHAAARGCQYRPAAGTCG
jgi:hypothetical protein